jgi:acyl-CoA synthetase (NDP forming)
VVSPSSPDAALSIDRGADRAARLSRFFAPRGIAVVGASEGSAWSRYTLDNLRAAGYPHAVFAVNRRGEAVDGVPAVRSLSAIGANVDLAYILTGPGPVADILDEAAQCGIRNAVVIAAGYSEAGADGRDRERDLVARAAANDQIFLGPNNLGFINTRDATAAWSGAMPLPQRPGRIGLLSQSGALGIQLVQYLHRRDLTMSHLITLGNEAMLTLTDGMEYLLANDGTNVIAMYVESIRSPEAFVRIAAQAVEVGKPIVIYKAGRTVAGAKVTAAHTGSLAGDDRVIGAIFEQYGVIRVDSFEDLVTTSALLSEHGKLPGPRIGFVTASGAACGYVADIAAEHGLEIPDFSADTAEILRASVLPPFATAQNPLDVTGQIVAEPGLLDICEKVVAEDPNIDMLMVIDEVPSDARAAAVTWSSGPTRRERQHRLSIPVISVEFLPSDRTDFARDYNAFHRAPPLIDSLSRTIPALGKAVWWSQRVDAILTARGAIQEPTGPDEFGIRLDSSGAGGRWSEFRAANLLRRAGLPVVPQQIVRTSDEAASVSAAIGYPVAMKIVSGDIPHKTDIGAVVLDVRSGDEASGAFSEIMSAVLASAPDAELEGVAVSPMRAPGVDLLVGVVRDGSWGPMLVVALGGIWVEILKDSAMRRLPVTPTEVRTMLAELKAFPLLLGARGSEPVELDALASVISRIGDVAIALGDRLTELEINPLRARGQNVEVLDSLVRWTEVGEQAPGR